MFENLLGGAFVVSFLITIVMLPIVVLKNRQIKKLYDVESPVSIGFWIGVGVCILFVLPIACIMICHKFFQLKNLEKQLQDYSVANNGIEEERPLLIKEKKNNTFKWLIPIILLGGISMCVFFSGNKDEQDVSSSESEVNLLSDEQHCMQAKDSLVHYLKSQMKSPDSFKETEARSFYHPEDSNYQIQLNYSVKNGNRSTDYYSCNAEVKFENGQAICNIIKNELILSEGSNVNYDNKKNNINVDNSHDSQRYNDGRCRAITRKGSRCSRSVKSNGYCWQHGG